MPKKNINSTHEYIEKCKPENQEIFTELLNKLVSALPNHQINLKYGFPILDGYGKVGFDERSKYIVIYFHHFNLHQVVEKYKDSLGSYIIEKESLRYKTSNEIPIDSIVEIAKILFTQK